MRRNTILYFRPAKKRLLYLHATYAEKKPTLLVGFQSKEKHYFLTSAVFCFAITKSLMPS